MTTTPASRLTGVAERVLCLLAWACQAAAATTYLVITFRPGVWSPTLASDTFSAICLWIFIGGMALLWPISLWAEQKNFYHRGAQRLHRRGGLLAHFALLLTALVASIEQSNKAALWAILPFFSFMALITWSAWMRTRFLPAEDQAVIDAIAAREAEQAAALYDASEKERRRERLGAIVASLGYQIADTQPASQEPPSEPVRWEIPARKHQPLVYFIRNGNRIKIGTTTELKRRIRTLALRPENVALLLPGGRPLERELHRQFADFRIGNSEWFAYDGPLVDFVHTQNASRKDVNQ